MAVVPLPELQQLAGALAGERHDAYSERALSRAYEEYLARRRTPIAPFRLWPAKKNTPRSTTCWPTLPRPVLPSSCA